MSKAHVEPAELRRFAQDLARFNNELQTLVGGLHARMRNLELTWRDQEHRKFAESFEQTAKSLASSSKPHISTYHSWERRPRWSRSISSSGESMGDSARVDSIDALRVFRAALFKFAETATLALGDVESDLRDTLNWLEHEQFAFWQNQIRKRQDTLMRAKEAVRMKKLFKDSVGRTPAAIEEEKALRVAQVRLEEAEQKLVNVKKYTRLLQKEIEVYKGQAQRFATTVQSDIPVAAATLDGWAAKLDEYVNLATVDAPVKAPDSLSGTEG